MPIIERARLDEKPRRSASLAHGDAIGHSLPGAAAEIPCATRCSEQRETAHTAYSRKISPRFPKRPFRL